MRLQPLPAGQRPLPPAPPDRDFSDYEAGRFRQYSMRRRSSYVRGRDVAGSRLTACLRLRRIQEELHAAPKLGHTVFERSPYVWYDAG
jgi:hypothetical protein